MGRWGYKSLWSVAICLILLGTIAVGAYRDTTESQTTMPSDQYSSQSRSMAAESNMWSRSSEGIHGRAGMLQAADKAVGTSVHNNQGDKIGTIKDFIVDKDRNAVSYVILSSGLKYYPIPWSAFKTGDKTYTLDITKDGLRDAPTISSDDPKLLTSDVTQKVQSFYSSRMSGKPTSSMMQSAQDMSQSAQGMSQSSQDMSKSAQDMTRSGQEMSKSAQEMARSAQGMTKSEQAMSTTANFYSCKKTLGMDIKNDQDKKVGQLEDIVFDVRQGNLAYGLVGFGGTMGLAKKTAAVPWNAIQIQPDQKIARLNTDERTLSSVEINKDQIARLNDPTFARQVHQSFGQEPYWEVYGYVPPSGEAVRPAMAAGAFATGAWAASSDYNRAFRTDAMTTVEGTVKSVDTFRPEIGAAQRGVELKIETANKETETIQLGPQSWMDSQNFRFNAGDRVTVTGSKVRHGLTKVIMASDVRKGDQTMRLRDEQGKPLWSSSEMRSGMSAEPNRPGTPNEPATGTSGTNY